MRLAVRRRGRSRAARAGRRRQPEGTGEHELRHRGSLGLSARTNGAPFTGLSRSCLVSARNSARVRSSSRTRPRSAEVVVRAPGFWTPRMRHAEVLGVQHDADAARRQLPSSQSAICTVMRSCTCRRRAKCSTTRASLDRPDDPLARQVRDVGHADERDQVVLAEGVERDRPGDDELVVALIVGEGRGRERLRREQLGVRLGHAQRRLAQPLGLRVDAERDQQLVHAVGGPLEVDARRGRASVACWLSRVGMGSRSPERTRLSLGRGGKSPSQRRRRPGRSAGAARAARAVAATRTNGRPLVDVDHRPAGAHLRAAEVPAAERLHVRQQPAVAVAAVLRRVGHEAHPPAAAGTVQRAGARRPACRTPPACPALGLRRVDADQPHALAPPADADGQRVAVDRGVDPAGAQRGRRRADRRRRPPATRRGRPGGRPRQQRPGGRAGARARQCGGRPARCTSRCDPSRSRGRWRSCAGQSCTTRQARRTARRGAARRWRVRRSR